VLNDQLLTEFADTFYGYGNFQANYWLVGMEEGGGNSVEEINLRLQTWERGGKRALEDLADFHQQIGMPEYFRTKAKLQTTWNKLIRIILSHQGFTPTTDDVRAYQRDKLGRTEYETCLLELLPLPSPSTSDWLYGAQSGLSQLNTREVYRNHFAPKRVKAIQDQIRFNQPRYVIFYGANYLEWWQAITNTTLIEEQLGKHRYWKGIDGGTIFMIVAHPSAIGITNSYFHEVGQILKEVE